MAGYHQLLQGTWFYNGQELPSFLGVADYHARQVLDGYCEGEFPKMVREKVGATYLYRVIGE